MPELHTKNKSVIKFNHTLKHVYDKYLMIIWKVSKNSEAGFSKNHENTWNNQYNNLIRMIVASSPDAMNVLSDIKQIRGQLKQFTIHYKSSCFS